MLIAVVDRLRGFPEPIEAMYPQAQIQTCIVHLIRNLTSLASWQERNGSLQCSSRSTTLPALKRPRQNSMPLLKAIG